MYSEYKRPNLRALRDGLNRWQGYFFLGNDFRFGSYDGPIATTLNLDHEPLIHLADQPKGVPLPPILPDWHGNS